MQAPAKLHCKSTNILYGILMMILSQASFATAWGVVKLIGKEVSTIELVFFRATLSLAIVLPLAYARAGTLAGKNYKLLFVRGLVGFIGMFCSFYALVHLRLGDAALLTNTAPIFVAILSPFLLKERTSKWLIVCIASAFLGLGLMLKPTAGIFQPAALFAVASGICVASAAMVIRKLHETDSSSIITFYFTTIVTLLSAPSLLFGFRMPGLEVFGLLFLVAISVTAAQLFLTRALKFAPSNVVSPFGYLSVIISYAVGVIFWDEIPGFYSILGAALVMASGVAIAIIAKGRDQVERCEA